MYARLFALAVSALALALPASAQEMQPRFKQLLTAMGAQKPGACMHMISRNGLGDMVPAIYLRKDKNSSTEFIVFRYYPMYSLITLSVKTDGQRFENKCREASVALLAKNGTVDGAAFVGCPGKDYDESMELYGIGRDGKPTANTFKAAWQKRADDYLKEIESIVPLCRQ